MKYACESVEAVAAALLYSDLLPGPRAGRTLLWFARRAMCSAWRTCADLVMGLCIAPGAFRVCLAPTPWHALHTAEPCKPFITANEVLMSNVRPFTGGRCGCLSACIVLMAHPINRDKMQQIQCIFLGNARPTVGLGENMATVLRITSENQQTERAASAKFKLMNCYERIRCPFTFYWLTMVQWSHVRTLEPFV